MTPNGIVRCMKNQKNHELLNKNQENMRKFKSLLLKSENLATLYYSNVSLKKYEKFSKQEYKFMHVA